MMCHDRRDLCIHRVGPGRHRDMRHLARMKRLERHSHPPGMADHRGQRDVRRQRVRIVIVVVEQRRSRGADPVGVGPRRPPRQHLEMRERSGVQGEPHHALAEIAMLRRERAVAGDDIDRTVGSNGGAGPALPQPATGTGHGGAPCGRKMPGMDVDRDQPAPRRRRGLPDRAEGNQHVVLRQRQRAALLALDRDEFLHGQAARRGVDRALEIQEPRAPSSRR